MSNLTKCGWGFWVLLSTGSMTCRADLIHYFPFDVDASDVVGAADGELLNGASVAGGALVTDGVDDYVQFGSKIVPVTGSFSVAIRFATGNDTLRWEELISQGVSGCCGFYIGKHQSSGGFRAGDSWSGNPDVPWPSSESGFNWAVLVVNADMNVSRFQLNDEATDEIGHALLRTNTGTNTRLAQQFGFHGEYFEGMIDELRIYDHALSGEEIDALLADVSLCPTDLNGDGGVTFEDILIVLGFWGTCDGCDADFDGDGAVGFADLLTLLADWGPCVE